MSFFLGSLCYGAAASGWKRSNCANLRALAVPLGGCANTCVSFFLARGGCKWSETELAQIYVRLLCPRTVVRTLAREFTFQLFVTSGKARGVAHSHLDTYCWVLALANLQLQAYTDACTCIDCSSSIFSFCFHT